MSHSIGGFPTNYKLCIYKNDIYLDYYRGVNIKILPMEVFYDTNPIANIFLLLDVAQKYIVVVDTGNKNAMDVRISEDKFLKLV